MSHPPWQEPSIKMDVSQTNLFQLPKRIQLGITFGILIEGMSLRVYLKADTLEITKHAKSITFTIHNGGKNP